MASLPVTVDRKAAWVQIFMMGGAEARSPSSELHPPTFVLYETVSAEARRRLDNNKISDETTKECGSYATMPSWAPPAEPRRGMPPACLGPTGCTCPGRSPSSVTSPSPGPRPRPRGTCPCSARAAAPSKFDSSASRRRAAGCSRPRPRPSSPATAGHRRGL
jgi:hypothetical protein